MVDLQKIPKTILAIFDRWVPHGSDDTDDANGSAYPLGPK
jgi:hypothetical protein